VEDTCRKHYRPLISTSVHVHSPLPSTKVHSPSSTNVH